MNEKTTKLIELIKENPDLPIVPMVYTEVVGGDEYRYWKGCFGECSVEEYVVYKMYGDDRIVFKDDEDEIYNYLLEYVFDDSDEYTDEEAEKLAEAEIEKIKWTKAIVVFIESM